MVRYNIKNNLNNNDQNGRPQIFYIEVNINTKEIHIFLCVYFS